MTVRIDAQPSGAPLFAPATELTPSEFARASRLPPEEATRYMRARDRVRLTYDWRELWQDEHARQFTVSRLARADLLQSLRSGLEASVAGDLTRRDWTRNARELLERAGWWGEREVTTPEGRVVRTTFDPARLRLIYDVNTRMAYAAGRWERIQAARETHPYLRYVTRADERVRESHRRWHNLTLPVDDSFWRTHYPPNGWRCMPGDTAVRASARLGQRFGYTGEMVELHTALGHRLTLTVNHPVLTGRGWVAAGEVQAGDQVLAARGDVDAALQGIVDEPQPPVRADDLFEALAAQGLRVVPMAAHDFDGDAAGGEGEVHIAGADRVLMDEWQAALDEGGGERRLDAALHGSVEAARVADRPALTGAVVQQAVAAQDAADLRLAQAHALADSGLAGQPRAVEREDAALDLVVAGIGRGPGSGQQQAGLAARLDIDPAGAHGGTAPAQRHAAVRQQPAQRVTADARLLRELLERNPGQVARDEIVGVRKFQWSGHVYDFTTTTGLMLAGGLVVSNCRCRAVPMRRAEYERRTDLVRRAPQERLVNWVDTRTGQAHQVPAAVDPGFAYNVGEAAARWRGLVEAGRRKVADYASDIGAGAADALNSLAQRDWADWLPLATAGRAGRRQGWLGVVAAGDLAHLRAAGIEPVSVEVMVRPGVVHGREARRHEAAGDALSAAQWAALPQAWARGAQALLRDERSGRLLWLLPGAPGQRAPVAVEANFVSAGPKRRTNAVESAYVARSAELLGRIRGGQLELLWGSVE